jgi:hypothetical protein
MELVVFTLNYSSWSTRAWLALDHAGADFSLREIRGFVDPDWRERLLRISGAARYVRAIWAQPSVERWTALAEKAHALPMYDEYLEPRA